MRVWVVWRNCAATYGINISRISNIHYCIWIYYAQLLLLDRMWAPKVNPLLMGQLMGSMRAPWTNVPLISKLHYSYQYLVFTVVCRCPFLCHFCIILHNIIEIMLIISNIHPNQINILFTSITICEISRLNCLYIYPSLLYSQGLYLYGRGKM